MGPIKYNIDTLSLFSQLPGKIADDAHYGDRAESVPEPAKQKSKFDGILIKISNWGFSF